MILRRGPAGNGRTFHFEKGYILIVVAMPTAGSAGCISAIPADVDDSTPGEDYPFRMERIVFFIEGELVYERNAH